MIPQLQHLNRHERRQVILFMEQENAKWPAELTPVPEESWPSSYSGHHRPVGVWRSREFVVQVFLEGDSVRRMSVNRTHVDPATLRWVDVLPGTTCRRSSARPGLVIGLPSRSIRLMWIS